MLYGNRKEIDSGTQRGRAAGCSNNSTGLAFWKRPSWLLARLIQSKWRLGEELTDNYRLGIHSQPQTLGDHKRLEHCKYSLRIMMSAMFLAGLTNPSGQKSLWTGQFLFGGNESDHHIPRVFTTSLRAAYLVLGFLATSKNELETLAVSVDLVTPACARHRFRLTSLFNLEILSGGLLTSQPSPLIPSLRLKSQTLSRSTKPPLVAATLCLHRLCQLLSLDLTETFSLGWTKFSARFNGKNLSMTNIWPGFNENILNGSCVFAITRAQRCRHKAIHIQLLDT